MAEEKWREVEIRIRYKDTDRMGVVYYGNYLTYFEVGRAEYMRELGFPYSRVEGQGYALVVIEAGARYHANVGYDSVIKVETRIGELRSVRLRFDYRVLDETGRLLVTGYTVHACLNSKQKATRIPPDLKKVLEDAIKAQKSQSIQ